MVKRAQHRRRWLPGLLLALVMLLNACAASADGDSQGLKIVDPVDHFDNCSAVLYDNTSGLPTSEANAIVETSDGFIWIGSYAGLIRYDGNTFERLSSTTGLTSVVSLYVDSRERLWIGTNDNGVAVMEHGEFRRWGKLEGMKSAHTRAITGDQNGNIYVATTSGIMIIDQQYNLTAMEEADIADAYMRSLVTGPDGKIYGTTDSGDLITIQDGKLTSFIRSEDSSTQGAGYILPDPEAPGKVYVESSEFVLLHANMGESLSDIEKIHIEPLRYIQQMKYIDGKIWICAGNGIGVLDGDRFTVLRELPIDNSVGNVMTDYLGNLWFTSSRQGVMKVVPNQFLNVCERYSLPQMVVNSTCMYKGNLFVATDTGLLVLGNDGPIPRLRLKKAVTASGTDVEADDLIALLDGCRIRSIIRDSRDQLWISTWRTCGLLRYANGELTVFTEEDGLLSNSIRAVSECADGRMLVALTGGVNVIEGDRVVAAYSKEDGIDDIESLTVAEGVNGEIVLGSNGGGIYILSESGTKNINVENGLPSDIVMRVKRDRSRDLIWIVTSSAIAYMTPDYQVTTIREFPYSNNFDLFENSKGDMWVLSSNGIYITPAEELIANGEITPVYYSIANGLCCITTANSYSELTDLGDLYIAGTTGICKVNIEKPLENVDDLKATVPSVQVDEQTIYPNDDGVFTIPSSTQKLTVPGFVFNYALSDPQVSYQLEGFERIDTTINRSDMAPVSYTNLRGGTYHFVMRLKDAMGRGNKEVAVTIVKEKTFYEQVWFYILVAVATALLIALLVKLYIRRRMRALEAKHREEVEREKAEKELQMATRIQLDALPTTAPDFSDFPDLNLRGSMNTAKEVGGDFYDYFPIDENRLCFLIADVSGKGIPAALFMMTAKTMIKDYALNLDTTSKIYTAVNARLCESNEANMFATSWIGIVDKRTMTLQYTNAGHNYPVLQHKGQPCEMIKKNHGLFLGGMEFMRYRQDEIQLEPGDRLLLYTDGVVEAHNRDNVLYGDDRLMSMVDSTRDLPGEQVLERIFADVNEHAAEVPQFDDITMVVLSIQ